MEMGLDVGRNGVGFPEGFETDLAQACTMTSPPLPPFPPSGGLNLPAEVKLFCLGRWFAVRLPIDSCNTV